ncbi:unnamed protein product [Moneuplotes crassus]|uniref:Uncharacterized protein n=1 Tax=Euplotes crassus TaxID=5936 RepID=A0AAD1U5M5_EUPCR|nr:unnamed protein product [Moneuplotes crassus]
MFWSLLICQLCKFDYLHNKFKILNCHFHSCHILDKFKICSFSEPRRIHMTSLSTVLTRIFSKCLEFKSKHFVKLPSCWKTCKQTYYFCEVKLISKFAPV